MKAITIKEPWATLIAEGYKEYEFRTWKTNYRGDILIHTGKSFDKNLIEKFTNRKLKYSPGYIIAKATITDCILVDETLKKRLLKKDPEVYSNLKRKRTKNLYAFKLENVKRIDKIPAKGKLSLWDYKKDNCK